LSDGSDDWDPMATRQGVEISVDLEHEIALVQQEPMRARLTYRFRAAGHRALTSRMEI
jgi:hypothetical protein